MATLSVVVLALVPVCASAQILTATAKTRDPDFAGVRVLLLISDRQAAVGIVLNKSSGKKLGDILPHALSPDAPVGTGGPVELGLNAIVESPAQPPGSTRLAPGVFWIRDRGTIARLAPPAVFRIFAGTCGWTRKQLDGEIRAGLWRLKAVTPAGIRPRVWQSETPRPPPGPR